MRKEVYPMRQELNYPIIDPCFESEEDKELYNHARNMLQNKIENDEKFNATA